ncbi:hypothetical protein D3C81_1345520 [compost metagenome]
MFGVPLAKLGAFLDFATGLSNWLAHFLSDHGGHGFAGFAQRTGEGAQQARAILQRLAFPFAEAISGAGQCGVERLRGFKRVVTDLLAVGGIDRDGVGLAGNLAHGIVLQVRRMGLE